MAISYAGLPGKKCSACSGVLFARLGNVLRCGQCQPPAESETADEWLEARYERGVLRWAASLPPVPPSEPTAFLYVSDNLDWVETEPSDEIAVVCHVGPMKVGRWFRRLDRQLFAWLVERVYRMEKQFFIEDFQDALALLREIAARAIEVSVFGQEFADESRWPRSAGGFDPYGDLPDLKQLEFPGFSHSPVAARKKDFSGSKGVSE